MTEQRRLPGRARPRAEVLREYQEARTQLRSRIVANGAPAVLADVYAPEPEHVFRWRVQLDCGCLRELFTYKADSLPTAGGYNQDHVYHSRLAPGEVFCDDDAHRRPQPYQPIVQWEQRRTADFPPDPAEPPEWWLELPEVWAKVRHNAPHTRAFWMVTLACGHRSEVVADVDWQPSDGPHRADPKRVEEMVAEWEQHWAAHPEEADSPEAEHDRRMLAQGWPRPATETRCYACSRVRQIIAYEPIGWLATEPKAKPATPRPPSRATLQRRLRELDAERARLRAQLESSEEDDA